LGSEDGQAIGYSPPWTSPASSDIRLHICLISAALECSSGIRTAHAIASRGESADGDSLVFGRLTVRAMLPNEVCGKIFWVGRKRRRASVCGGCELWMTPSGLPRANAVAFFQYA